MHSFSHAVEFELVPFFRMKKALLEQKYKCSQAEENEARAVLQYQLLKAEMDKLRQEVQHQQQQRQAASCSTSTPASSNRRYKVLLTQWAKMGVKESVFY